MKLKWLGHSCFQLTLNNSGILVTDPFDESVGYPLPDVRADAVLTSHGHHDHNYTKAIQGDFTVLNAPGQFEACGAKSTGVASCHDDQGGAKRGANVIFRIEADGVRVVHLGDLGHLPQTDEQKAALAGADVLLIPIGGFYTIDTPAAVQIIEAFRPRAAIAMHYKNRYCGFPVSDNGAFIRLTGAKTLPNEIDLSEGVPEGCFVMEI